MGNFPAKSIKISEETYRRINAIVGMLREREKKPISMDAALMEVLPKSTLAKPSDFAGAWKMSGAEAEKLKGELKAVWKLWKKY